jgi:hypothetical protein
MDMIIPDNVELDSFPALTKHIPWRDKKMI